MPTERTPEQIARHRVQELLTELHRCAAARDRCVSNLAPGPFRAAAMGEAIAYRDCAKRVAALLAQPAPSETEGRE